MLLVKTKLGLSTIHGIGLFADEDIPKGTVIWVFHENFDREYTDEDLQSLPEALRHTIYHYSYVSSETKKLVFCADDARFMNHTDGEPNTESVYNNMKEGCTVAKHDIKKGEELTCDYFEFDLDAPRKLGRPSKQAVATH